MNDRPFTILIVSPDRPLLGRLSRFLEVFGYEVGQVADARQALAAAQARSPDFLLIDGAARRPADLQLSRQIRKLSPRAYAYSLLISESPEADELTEALEAGFDDFLARPVVFGELLARLRAGARVIEFERRLAAQAGTDPFTGLPDRMALVAQLSKRLPAATATPGWLAVFDLDYFSRVQKAAGEAAAEALLREAAQVLRGESADDLFFAALGADQFAALGAGDIAAGSTWAQSALQRLAAYEFRREAGPLELTASCGLTAVVANDAAELIFCRAEKALRLSKSQGRNCLATADEVEADAAAWNTEAEGGQLFATTLARDVMLPCPLLLDIDETIEQSQVLAELTHLSAIPVVDAEGRLAGVVTAAQLEAVRSRAGRPRGGSSVRMLRHVMTTDVKRFEEATPLAELMEFFTEGTANFAVVVRDRRPKGMVHCQGLAALNEKLTARHFAAPAAPTAASADLLVPDLAAAE